MTTQEVQALTDEEIRVKVAELQGWENVHRFNKWQEGGPASCKDGDLVGDFNGRTRCHLPNYPADLNACHEVEKMLTNEQWPAYSSTLWRITNQAPSNYECHASARQRCEALLITLTQP